MDPNFEAGFEKTALFGLPMVAKGIKNIGTSFFKNMVRGTAGAVKTVATKAIKNPLKTTMGVSLGADIVGKTKEHMAQTVSPNLSSRYIGV